MLATNIPILLYTVPAIAGVLFIIPAIEFGTKWAFLCYGVSAVLSLILPTEKEALIVFIGALGLYPTVKMLIERIGKKWLEILLKFAFFNATITASYWVVFKILGANPFQNKFFGLKVTILLSLLLGNIVFFIYDVALSRIILLYFIKLRKPIRKILGIKSNR